MSFQFSFFWEWFYLTLFLKNILPIVRSLDGQPFSSSTSQILHSPLASIFYEKSAVGQIIVTL